MTEVVNGLLGPRIQHLCGSAVGNERRRVMRTQQATVPARSNLCRASGLATSRKEEVWETLTYAVLWLCGLGSIGLCCV
jgi:hypothetical protein